MNYSDSSEKRTNRLINEKSPYLLQHSRNPVDWYPWGAEAFSKAKKEKKPVFLSIGYSSCHWCHVMESESFEDEEVAKYLADNFISVKVDREERPDVDNIYMTACNAMTGSGGWPLSAFITDEQKPFFVGTYYPKKHFLSLLRQINEVWRKKRADLERQSEILSKAVSLDTVIDGEINYNLPRDAFHALERMFDTHFGGFGTEPKFPSPHLVIFLLRYSKHDVSALDIAVKTLDAYRNGGLYDHIGYGFFRYSTDRKLRIPHFEKMLYDNALLCLAYAEAHAVTAEERFAETAREIIEYLYRDLHGNGGFFTAEDADSEGKEGKFYTFGENDFKSLTEEEYHAFEKIFPLSEPNFENEIHLYRIKTPSAAEKEIIDRCRKKLFSLRNGRKRPMRDEKIITSQNGMTLAALAAAGHILGDAEILDKARETAEFIWNKLSDKKCGLYSLVIGNKVGTTAFSDDYAYFIYGLLELYNATGDDIYIKRANMLNKRYIVDYYSADGGFYQTANNAEKLIARSRNIHDGAVPSDNAVAVNNLIRLSYINNDTDLLETAKESIEAFTGTIEASPVSYCFSVMNVLMLNNISTVTIAANSSKEADEIRKIIPYSRFDIVKTVIDCDSEYKPINGEAAVYICRNNKCFPPVSGMDNIKSTLLS